MRADEPAKAAERVRAAPAAAAASDAPAVVVRRANAETPPPVSDPVSGGVATADAMQIPPTGLEFCDVRRVSADELRRWKADPVHGKAQAADIEAQMQRQGEAALAQIAARLAAGSERQQVAARLLMRDADGAALLAQRSSDAQAYQMALTACGSHVAPETPNCARLDARRWAELDPSDARPWLRLMDAALQRRDPAAVDEALAQAAARPRLSRGEYLLEAQAMAAAPAAPDVAGFGNALVMTIGFDAAMMGVDMGAPIRACKGDALKDAMRLAHCRAVARQVLAGATDLIDATLAQKLADRVGLPPEQQAHDAATLKTAGQRLSQHMSEDIGMDCAGMRRIHRLSATRAADGDLAMALALLPARPAR
ncbi:hypothetical protein [Roseateles asaccharophilus]|uniref:DUF222 domain-containing protein n=1 Tax=Roseateles asaccharophilus TaxID=582607 RepID=A0ABU2A3A2_9BURK|nr:hypothetical protein [Roseateles asaccharophilus]MDR7331673.1 hypothetical protein [Roseateles asaccharophilus]